MDSTGDDQPLFVDSPQGLAALCERLAPAPWLALDTEFMRERTYQPQLCLLQVGTPEIAACVDPLAIGDLGPLLDQIYDPQRVKVLHAARQDLEILYLLRGELPGPVFDTQIAATVLGHGDQIGYGTLVQNVLGIQLDKSHARADWSRRPLEPAQLRYAADDVRYLAQIYPRLHAQLVEEGRLEWLSEDFAALSRAQTYTNPPEEAWRRVSGANRLRGVQLAILQALAAWREERAQALDKPRKWILKDDVLADLARHAPADLKHLERIRGLDEGTARRSGGDLLAIIRQAGETPKAQWPELAPRLRLAPGQEAVVDAMMAVLRQCAERHRVSVPTLAARRDLEAIAAGRRDVPLLHGWRAALAGQAIDALLAGETTLRVRDGQLVAEPGAS